MGEFLTGIVHPRTKWSLEENIWCVAMTENVVILLNLCWYFSKVRGSSLVKAIKISRRKRKQQNRRLFCLLDESAGGFRKRRDIHDTLIRFGTTTKGEKVAYSGDTNHLIPVGSSQVDMQSFKGNISKRVRCEVSAEGATRVHDKNLAARDSLAILRVELAVKLINVSSEHDVDGVVLDPDEKYFTGNVGGLQMTASSWLNFNKH